MYKYPGVYTPENHFIPYTVDSTSIRPLQGITSNLNNLSDHDVISFPTSNNLHEDIPSRRAIIFNLVDYDLNTYRGRAEIARHHHSCLYLDEEDIEVIRENHSEIIKKNHKGVSSDDEPLTPITEERFDMYKGLSTNINLTDVYNNVRIVLSQNPLAFHFPASSLITMRNKLWDHLIRHLEGTEKAILTLNGHKPLSNEELTAIVRNATKNIDFQLDAIMANF